MIGLLISLCCSYIYTLNLVFFYIYFQIFKGFSASHAPTHYLWFASVETQTETRLSIKQTFIYHKLKSALCCGDSHFILDNILVNISASPVCPFQPEHYCKAKASLQTCTRCAKNATWHCCSYSWRKEKKTPH